MPDPIDSFGERSRKSAGTITVSLQQMKCDALCRFLADAWHAAKAVD
jgi:hypothetical protein